VVSARAVRLMLHIPTVIPAKAGTQFLLFRWAPAFAGVTKKKKG